jgi:HSP20 family protein
MQYDVMPSSSNKSRVNVRRGRGNERAYNPRLQDFKRRSGSNSSGNSSISRVNDAERRTEPQRAMQSRRMDNIFDTFRNDIEHMMDPWSSSSSVLDWRFPSVFRGREQEEETDDMMVRMPIFDMVDKGDRYELKAEVPGIEKEKIKVKATKDSVEISGEQSEEEKLEDKTKRYVYNERSYSSFYRNIPVPEEIVSSKVSAKMSNGILHVDLPKKNPTKTEQEEATTVEIK